MRCTRTAAERYSLGRAIIFACRIGWQRPSPAAVGDLDCWHLMRTLTVILGLCGFALSVRSETNEQPAIVRTLLEQGQQTVQSDLTTACINLTRDVQDKRLTVYAVVSTAKAGVTNQADFTIRVTL